MQRILIILMLLITWQVSAQDSHLPSLNELSFDLKLAGGKILKHTPKVYLDAPPFSQEIEFSISHRTFGKRSWEAQNNFLIPSLNFTVINYGSQDFGQVYAFFPAIEYNILRKNNFAWRVKFGGGISYVTEHWERSDTLNNYVGSSINNFTLIQLGANYIVSDHIELQAGARISHISNGTYRQPNFGINNTTGFVGINYYPVSTQLPYTKETVIPKENQWLFGIRKGLSFSEINTPDGAMFPIFSLSAYANNTFLQKHRYFFGADITYNQRAEGLLRYSYNNLDNLSNSSWNSSIFGGAELLYGKVGIPLQVGIYTRKMPNLTKFWYQKVGMSYYFYQNDNHFFKKAFASAILKTHTQNADNIEFCLGFMF